MLNPFEYGGIVSAGSFCNRVVELADLKRAAENSMKLFITGERRVGKTTLMCRLLDDLRAGGCQVAMIDLWRCIDTSDFLRECAAAFGAMGDRSPVSILERSRRFFGGLRPSVTVGDDGRPALMFSNVPREADTPLLTEILTVPGALADENPEKSVVVVFDEFQQIRELKDPRIERLLRSEVQKHGNVAYFFCGSRKHMLRKMFLEGGSPLYRSAAHFPLGTIDEEDWKPFIRAGFSRKDVHIGDKMIEGVCSLTSGHPFYTQMFCAVLWEGCEPGTQVEQGMLETTLETVIRRESDAYHALWESLPVNSRKMLRAVAIENPLTEPTSSRLRSRYGLSSPSSAITGLEKLVWKDIVEPLEDAYHISDRFLGIWVRKQFDQNPG